MSREEYNKEGINCKYGMDIKKQYAQCYLKINLKIVNAKSCNNEEFKKDKDLVGYRDFT